MAVLRSLGAVFDRSNVPVISNALRALTSQLRIAREFLVDARDYARVASYRPRKRDSVKRERDLVIAYHQIEKGLSLPDPRRPFGAGADATIVDILSNTPIEEISPASVAAARRARRALRDWNSFGSADTGASPEGPKPWSTNLQEFFQSRRSCRNFDRSRSVDRKLIDGAIEVAQSAPSVCNRRAGRLHLYRDQAKIHDLLALQNGNRGFGDTVQNLMVVTADRRYFRYSGERNQRWIDGALFAMTFVWGLHAEGLATCMLNWSMGVTATRALRSRGDIPDHEDIICMVAFGYAAPSHRVARSDRIDAQVVLKEH